MTTLDVPTNGRRARWAAVGAALAIAVGAGSTNLISAGGHPVVDRGDVLTLLDEPCRLLDTRPTRGVGGRTTPLGPAETISVEVVGDSGNCTGISTKVTGALLNVTALLASGPTHFTIWSGNGPAPDASSLNPSPGEPPTPNAVTTDLDDGAFSLFNNSGTVHVLIDLVGTYSDHDHDERYPTHSDVYAKADIVSILGDNHLWIRSTSAGQRVSGSRSSTVSPFAIGRYVVTFPRDIEACALLVSTHGLTDDIHSAMIRPYDLTPELNDAFVYIENEAGVLSNVAFSVEAVCPLVYPGWAQAS